MINGILNIYKEKGYTSHDVVARLRGILHQKKIGHTGTLDPAAEGVLPVCLGKATKLCSMLEDWDKEYRAVLLLGLETDTEDATGQVTASAPVEVGEQEVREIMASFTGSYLQVPPMYSAKKVGGRKLYELARQGITVERQPCPVEIHEIRIEEMHLPRVTFSVTCSKGTYVRSLVRDLGEYLGTCACMSYLVRVQAGVFTIEDAATLEELTCDPLRYVLPADASMGAVRKVTLSRENCLYLLQGRPVPFAGRQMTHGEILRVYTDRGVLTGIARFDKEHHVIRPHKMFADSL
ncbi:MAG TPA: tRNA pseudouridine(55) synthase TruB [Megasphaera sp.]|nr:tRNA pseudouridine(55) synthase TruB [Megasphaera sp.]